MARSVEDKFHQKRSCTDIPCLIIFIIFIGLMVIIASFAFVYGNPLRLTNGYDSYGNICGISNEPFGSLQFSGMDMTDRKYLFFLETNLNVFSSLKLCVKKCPDREILTPQELHTFAVETESLLCQYDVPLENYTWIYNKINNNVSVWENICPGFPIYESVPVLRRCVPKATKDIAYNIIYNIHAYLNNVEIFQQSLSDLHVCWKTILILSIVAAGLSFFLVMTIHYCAKFLWIFNLLFIVLFVASFVFTVVLWWTYASNKLQLDIIPEAELLVEMVRNESAFLVYSIFATIFTIVVLLIMLSLRKHVKKVSDLFNEASACIQSMPLLLLQPWVTCLALSIFIIFWIFVMLSLATANHATREGIPNLAASNDAPNIQTEKPVVNLSLVPSFFNELNFEQHTWVRSMWWIYLIAFVWICEFILACQQMVIAGSVGRWYFERNKNQLSFPIAKAVMKLFLYHIGSLALGSFLITIFKLPRLLINFIEKQFQRTFPGWCQGCVKCCKCCCKCCLWILEKFIRYMNHNAYTIIALRGESFCPSARRAFSTIMKNAMEVAVIDSVGDCILFFGKCIVTITTGFIAVLTMKSDPQLHFYAIPVLVVCVNSFFIAHCFFSVYEMVIDTLVLCMCEDSVLFKMKRIDRPFATESMKVYLHRQSMISTPNDDGESDVTAALTST